MSPTSQSSPTAGIQTGRVYEAKTPGFVQTSHGQGVYNDRLVVGLEQTGRGVLDYEVAYKEPSSDTTIKVPASLFIEQAGADVTASMPPVEAGKGIEGKGFIWREWAGPAAEHKAAAPVVFTPGAGQIQPQDEAVAASMPEGIKLPNTDESKEKNELTITQAPNPAAPSFGSPAPPAAPAPAAPAAADANDNPATGNFANSDSDTPAAGAPVPNSPLTRSPSRSTPNAPKTAAKSPSQQTEQAAGVDAGTTASAARKDN